MSAFRLSHIKVRGQITSPSLLPFVGLTCLGDESTGAIDPIWQLQISTASR